MIGKIAAEETDLPPGVLNVVTSGDKAAVGEMLTGDRRVDMISFTGSSATGRRIMGHGAETLKRVFLELGGKSANIILDDADFEAVVPSGAMTCMHAGQGCAITTRMLLPASRYDEGVALLEAAFKAFPYGDPNDLSNMMGPLINASQRERVLGYIEKGKSEGAKIALGGKRILSETGGYYIEPTVFDGVKNSMKIAQEEIFGPVLAFIRVNDYDEAIDVANNTEFGLTGAVYSKSEERLDRARDLGMLAQPRADVHLASPDQRQQQCDGKADRGHLKEPGGKGQQA